MAIICIFLGAVVLVLLQIVVASTISPSCLRMSRKVIIFIVVVVVVVVLLARFMLWQLSMDTVLRISLLVGLALLVVVLLLCTMCWLMLLLNGAVAFFLA